MKFLLKSSSNLTKCCYGALFVVLLILLFFLIVAAFIRIYDFTASRLPVPEYQKPTGEINLSAICEKIKDDELQKSCFLKIEKPDAQLSLLISKKIGEEKENILLCRSIPLSDFLSQKTNTSALLNGKSLINYSPYRELESPYSEYLFCYQALTENPYYCKKLNYFYEVLSQSNCFMDAALAWNDPLLCDKLKNKDICYFRIILGAIK